MTKDGSGLILKRGVAGICPACCSCSTSRGLKASKAGQVAGAGPAASNHTVLNMKYEIEKHRNKEIQTTQIQIKQVQKEVFKGHADGGL